MKELAVISGKGGTGKTSLVGAIAKLASPLVCADCDVDAADLHLLLEPEVQETHEFEGGLSAHIDKDACIECDICRELCRYGAIKESGGEYSVDPFACEGCGVCHDNCPEECITLEREIAGDWFVSDTRLGPMVHAKLGIAQENSGKLVAQVRQRAKEVAEEKGLGMVLVDGSPGIGCPVISSITGADQVLVITEPTVSGLHDLERVLQLAAHFKIRAAVCVNKSDLNPEMAKRIADKAKEAGAAFVGNIPFDTNVTSAMVAEKTLPEFGESPAALAIQEVWNQVKELMNTDGGNDHANL